MMRGPLARRVGTAPESSALELTGRNAGRQIRTAAPYGHYFAKWNAPPFTVIRKADRSSYPLWLVGVIVERPLLR